MKLLIILLSLTFIACEKSVEEVGQALKQPAPESSIETEPTKSVASNESYTVIRDETSRFEGVNMSSPIIEGSRDIGDYESKEGRNAITIYFKEDGKFWLHQVYYNYEDTSIYSTGTNGDFKVELIEHEGEEKMLVTMLVTTSRVFNLNFVRVYGTYTEETVYTDKFAVGVATDRSHILSNELELKFIYNEFSQSIEKFEDDIMGNLIGTEFDRIY